MVHRVQEIRPNLEPLHHKTLLPVGQRFNSSARLATSGETQAQKDLRESLQAFVRADCCGLMLCCVRICGWCCVCCC
jgi:hypothetical protein